MKAVTVADLQTWAMQTLADGGIERPGFEMQLLLALALGVSRVAVITGSYPAPDEAQLQEFVRLVSARAHRMPLAYLRGNQEFYGLPFRVTPAVLIPRPETEMLVDAAIAEYRRAVSERHAPFTMADVGTGTGCIPIAVLTCCPLARAVAYDISSQALDVARLNAAAIGVVDRLRLVQGDLLTAAYRGRYDLIVSNPPYIPTGEIPSLQVEVRDYEPPVALDGGPDGRGCYPQIVADACRALKPGGHLYVEVGQGQAPSVAETFRGGKMRDVQILSDLAGIERVVGGIR